MRTEEAKSPVAADVDRRANVQRILVVQPSWVGDAVMATPALRSLRKQFPDAHISYLLKRYVRPIYAGMPWCDRLLTYRQSTKFLTLVSRIRAGRFDAAVLLSNSFRGALMCRLAGVRRIVGYARDGRSLLLTDRLPALKSSGAFVPTPIVGSYLKLVTHLGVQGDADGSDKRLELFVTPRELIAAERVMSQLPKSNGPIVMLNPGAQYGAAKCWPAEYFAAIADRLKQELGATVLVSSAPREKAIVDDIRRRAKEPFIDLASLGPSLGSLKEIIRRCDLMITNDTGPRHIAAAMNTPVVTLFGPTHQAWTEIDFPFERKLQIDVICGPCQKKLCPLDHRCMTRLTPDMVWAAAIDLLSLKTTGRIPLPVI